MKYLAPNDQHQITVPVIVGAEYTIPIAEPKLAIRQGGITTRSLLPLLDATDLSFEVGTPNVIAGELQIINVEVIAQTQVGTFNYREIFGVVDTLDIPTSCDAVRALLGVTFDELTDQDINLEGQYIEVYKWLINNFHNLRQTDAYLTKKFGDLVALIAAIYAAPTLIIRLDKSRRTENGEFQRLVDAKHFQNFLDTLQGNLSKLKEDLADFLEIPEAIALSVFEFIEVKQWSINS